MAKRVEWSTNAIQDRRGIFEYWNKRTGSKAYSRKLDKILREVVQRLSKHPKLGTRFKDSEERYSISGNYLIIYIESKERVRLLYIWDSRRDPDILSVLVGKRTE